MSGIFNTTNGNAISLNNIPIQSGKPASGHSIIYDVPNQWVFRSSGSGGTTGPTGAGGSGSPATTTSLGTIVLAGI